VHIDIGGHFADTGIAEISVSAQIQVSVVNFSSIMGQLEFTSLN
jgi:hypothetical protein